MQVTQDKSTYMFRTTATTRLKLISLIDVGIGPDAALNVPHN